MRQGAGGVSSCRVTMETKNSRTHRSSLTVCNSEKRQYSFFVLDRKIRVITLFFTRSCNLSSVFQFWFTLAFSCIAPACVHATPSHSPHACSPHRASLESVMVASAFQTGQRGNPNPHFSWLCSDSMTAGLAFTYGHARKRHTEESKKETFWQLQRAQNFFSLPG